jgi:hypothetical protein
MCCKWIDSVVFEVNLRLSRLDAHAFRASGITSIHIPASIEVICDHCVCYCQSLTSITLELGSHLSRIESYAFSHSVLIAL